LFLKPVYNGLFLFSALPYKITPYKISSLHRLKIDLLKTYRQLRTVLVLTSLKSKNQVYEKAGIFFRIHSLCRGCFGANDTIGQHAKQQ
jgi:hypothetical protein